MKILELTNYSAGICGVWARVKSEALELSKRGHNVRVFSSNLTKGSNKIANSEDSLGDIKIKRFPARQLGGESFMFWDFEKQAINFKPDIIITHSYRHPHTTRALQIAKKINAKVFLVAHAPFGRASTHSLIENITIKLYDLLIGRRTLNKFNKIITITQWENTYLHKLGVKREKITYIPNTIPDEFFKQKKSKEQNKILFLGRIAPIKDLETLILAFKNIRNKKIILEIVGPVEEKYLEKIKKLVRESNIEERVIFSDAIYKIKEKIRKIDSCKIFVLPSKSEGMPQSLIEAMARQKVVVSSDNQGAKEIIRDQKNGFLFKIGNARELTKKLDFALSKKQPKVKIQARKSVENYKIKNLIKKLEKEFK
jgi:glycosyltransferase involved in cell wall biosynthesis